MGSRTMSDLGRQPAKPRQVAPTPECRQLLRAGHCMPRHVHAHAYIAVVVEGSYWEANAAGRLNLRAGDVAVHGPYSAHCNGVGTSDAVVLNLVVEGPLADAYGRVRDLDEIIRLAHRDSIGAGTLALAALVPVVPAIADWPDQLAADLAATPRLCLSHWAHKHGLALETVSRGFKRLYGATPKRVRAEHRARRALAALLTGSTALAQLSLDAGFADQSCMTHAMRSLTGASPLALRRKSNGDKTGNR
jgi:AraC-like DNA-binding protein